MKHIALLGYGTVGCGTARVLTENNERIARRLGSFYGLEKEEISIKYILDLREFPDDPLGDRIVHDFRTILADEDIVLVAEMLGGAHPAYDFTAAALRAGKHVVTSNKEVVATFGDELLQIAAEHGVQYRFEASVGGGIPVITPLCDCLAHNEITEINAILNGTTNYILTAMLHQGRSFEEALAEARRLGYAEANPSAAVDGIDACRKISILGALAFGVLVDPQAIPTEGISQITTKDVEEASKRDMVIKLLGRAKKLADGRFWLAVEPYAIHRSHPLAHVEDVFNAIMVHGNAVDDVMFYGRGAGKYPTASAVCADILDTLALPSKPQPVFRRDSLRFVPELPEASVQEDLKKIGIPLRMLRD